MTTSTAGTCGTKTKHSPTMRETGEARPRFDREHFYATLDAIRAARGLTWRQAAREAGVSPSTFSRLAQGHAPDVNGFAALVAWSGTRADDFITRTRPVEDPQPFAVVLARFCRASGLDPGDAMALERVALTFYEAVVNRPGHPDATGEPTP